MTKKNIITPYGFPKKFLNNRLYKNLSKDFNQILKNLKKDIYNPKNTLNILSENYKFNFKTKDLISFKKYKNIVLIGMGGSILGSEAIYCFLKSKINKQVYFFDDIDFERNIKIKKNIDLKKTLFLIISKSGNTIETISNLISLEILKKNKKNIIIISERKNNYLFNLSKKLNLFYIEHKKIIGGRYSVLSEVGIVPAYLMGLNINKLRKNLKSHLFAKKNLFLKESSLVLSNLSIKKKYNNLIFLNYAPELEKFLYWRQQLMAESLGKKGKGLLPTVSNMPKDHHSLLQLYLDGPRDKIFEIFTVEKKPEKKLSNRYLSHNLSFLKNKTLQQIKRSQKDAMIKSFIKNKIPFKEYVIKKINEDSLSELFSYFIIETVIIGRLIKVNPFDQPAVEQVKKFTKDFLN